MATTSNGKPAKSSLASLTAHESAPAQTPHSNNGHSNNAHLQQTSEPGLNQNQLINTARDANDVASEPSAAAQDDEDAQMCSDPDALSEDEDSAVLLRMESDVSLPRAPVKQLIMEKLPKQARIHQQSKELISNLCMHFLMHLAEQANDFCSAQNKKTVCPDHVLDALVKMNLTRYFPKLAGTSDDTNQLQQAQQQPTIATKDSGKGKAATAKATKASKAAAAKKGAAAANQAEIDQRALRNAILSRLNLSMEGVSGTRGRGRGDRDGRGDDGLTDEQKNMEQEQLFREAREQYDQQQQMAAMEAAQVAESQPNAQNLASGQLEGGANTEDQQMLTDGQDPANFGANGQYLDPLMPPFNPTDFFRDMIFTTDFVNEQDAFMMPLNQPVGDQGFGNGHHQPEVFEQHQGPSMAIPADTNNQVMPMVMGEAARGNGVGQSPNDGDIHATERPNEHQAALGNNVTDGQPAIIDEGFFAFENDELAALDAELLKAAQQAETLQARPAESEAGSCSEIDAGAKRGKHDTKPKEQNDQEMIQEENKEPPRQ